MAPKEMFGIAVLGVGAILWPLLLGYGLLKGRTVNVFGTGLIGIAKSRVSGLGTPPLVVSRSTHPREFWLSMGLYIAGLLMSLAIAYVYFFLPHAD